MNAWTDPNRVTPIRWSQRGLMVLSVLIGVVLLAGCPKQEGPAEKTADPATVGPKATDDKPGAEKPTPEKPEADKPVEATEKATPEEATPEKATPEKATPEKATPEKKPAEKKPKLTIADVEVDCQKVCDYQFGCAAEALKAVGKPIEDSAQAKSACKMACDAGVNSKQPLAMRTYQASMACLDQPCGKDHTLCLTTILSAEQ